MTNLIIRWPIFLLAATENTKKFVGLLEMNQFGYHTITEGRHAVPYSGSAFQFRIPFRVLSLPCYNTFSVLFVSNL